ncbi:hypothetical protein [Priestia sp. YIM B13448]
MSLTQKDKENLLNMLDSSKNFEDLKLAVKTLIILEDFVEEKEA